MKSTLWKRLFVWGVLIVALVWTLFPLYWMLITSLKPMVDMFMPLPSLWPSRVTLDNYRDLLLNTHFLTFVKNSVTVGLASMAVSVAISALAAYSITRLRVPGRHTLATLVLVTYLVPQSILFIPMYLLVNDLGLSDTLTALVLIYPTFLVPYGTWMLMSYFRVIPVELEEAALIDGCGRLQAMAKVILPLAAPGLAVVAIFSFTLAWGEFIYALVVTTRSSVQTLPVGLSGFIVSDVYMWGRIMAAAVLASFPVVALYMLVQRWLVTGLAAGAVKG